MQRRLLIKAGLSAALIPMPAFAQETVPEEFDVVVIGGGAAGLTAAIAAAEKGASAVVLEKMPMVGGDTIRSGGYFNAVDPELQKALKIPDSVERFTRQILESGAGGNDEEVVKAYAAGSSRALSWLKAHGMVFEDELYEIYGGGWRRSHKPLSSDGSRYVAALSEAAIKSGVTVHTGCAAEEFLKDETGRVIGVSAVRKGQRLLYTARRGVIVASGGYGADKRLIREYIKPNFPLVTDTHPGATGEILAAAERIGAQLVNMDSVEFVPGSNPELNYTVRLDYEPGSVIFVNEKGERFAEETAGRREIVTRFVAGGFARLYSVADSVTVAAIPPLRQKNLYRALYAGGAFRADTIEELAAKAGLPAETLKRTVFASAAEKNLTHPPYWIVPVFFRIHYTLGGLRINSRAQCLNREGRPIPGLYAAGEVVGNIHGRNRLGGNGINSAVTFGLIAAEDCLSGSK
jgi:flavocytochrome c